MINPGEQPSLDKSIEAEEVKPIAGPSEPPPYSAPTAVGSSSSPNWPIRSNVRVNFISISERYEAINGTWTLDPTLRIPEALLMPIPVGETRDNLFLHSERNYVRAYVALISDAPCRSTINVSSEHHKVTIVIPARKNQRFRLNAKSNRNNVNVYIPRDFQGPINFECSKCGVMFSNDVHQNLVIFSREGKFGKGFIGDWSTSGYGELIERRGEEGKNEWTGDELNLSSDYGRIKIIYSDEPIKPKEVDLMKQDFQQGGPVGFIASTLMRNVTKGVKKMSRDETRVRYFPASSPEMRPGEKN